MKKTPLLCFLVIMKRSDSPETRRKRMMGSQKGIKEDLINTRLILRDPVKPTEPHRPRTAAEETAAMKWGTTAMRWRRDHFQLKSNFLGCRCCCPDTARGRLQKRVDDDYSSQNVKKGWYTKHKQYRWWAAKQKATWGWRKAAITEYLSYLVFVLKYWSTDYRSEPAEMWWLQYLTMTSRCWCWWWWWWWALWLTWGENRLLASLRHIKKKKTAKRQKSLVGWCCERGHRAPHSVDQSCPTRPEPLPSELGLNFLPAVASRSPRIHHRADPQQENTFVYRLVLRLSVASIQGGNWQHSPSRGTQRRWGM